MKKCAQVPSFGAVEGFEKQLHHMVYKALLESGMFAAKKRRIFGDHTLRIIGGLGGHPCDKQATRRIARQEGGTLDNVVKKGDKIFGDGLEGIALWAA